MPSTAHALIFLPPYLPSDMPISASLTEVIDGACRDASHCAGIAAAFEAMHIVDLLTFLSHKPSFMMAVLDEGQIGQLVTEVKRVRDASTPATDSCGGYDALPAVAVTAPWVRAMIYRARMLYAREEKEALVLPDPKAGIEDPFKPLPPADIDDIWKAGEKTTDGFSFISPKFHLSDANISRMVRANKAGQLWIPIIDQGFSYREPASNRQITTLFKSATGTSTEAQLQLVHGSEAAERFDPLNMVADYNDICAHRSAALVACYATPEASAAYAKCKTFAAIEKHKLVVRDAKPPRMILPRFIASLERHLRAATRTGVSLAQMVGIDSAVVNAIVERHSSVGEDGNLAIEHVCEQRQALFAPPVATISLGDVTGSRFASPGRSEVSIGPSASEVGGKRPTELERRLQSDLDKEKNRTKNRERDVKQKVTYGGAGRVMGGGNKRATEICRNFNSAAGCYRKECSFKHACDAKLRNGQACGDDRHSSGHH